MKKAIFFVLLLSGSLLWAQEEIISEEITGHIYKPQLMEPTEERISGLVLPEGFRIEKYAGNLGKPRMMAVSENGNVYVSRRKGDVVLLKDTNNDGKADERKTILTKEGAHGIAIYDDLFYMITVNDVFKAEMNTDGTIGELEKIIDDLPDGGQHPNRVLAFGPDGMMYISVGSTCNACEETREENATIVMANPDGGNREIYATGLRNTIGFDWHPETNQLYGMDHGIDWLGDSIQKEELNLITEAGNYGWPYIYNNGKHNKADKPPKMTWEQYAEISTAPVMMFTAHSAPMDLIFYTGEMFPAEYQNSALVSFRGSWNRKPASGYKIMKIDFKNGKPVGSEDFVTGFLSDDGTSHFARPVGLAQLPDGSVLLSDDTNGVIYRISYKE